MAQRTSGCEAQGSESAPGISRLIGSGDLHCANCGIRITWPAIMSDDKAYCCLGCALGGPCYCSYDHGGEEGSMKMVMAIVQNDDAEEMLDDLTAVGYRVTKIASTSGFLRRGNSVLLVGVDASLVDDVLDTLRQRCRARRWPVDAVAVSALSQGTTSAPIEIPVGGATVFVWDVERYERL